MYKISKIYIVFSTLLCILVLIASLSGLLNPITYLQESANWALQAKGQDIGNLLAITVFMGSLILLKRKYLVAYLIWLGTLLYFIYAYLIYAFFIHFNQLFLIYVAILGLSSYTLLGSLLENNITELTKPLVNKKNKTAAIVLITIGVLFGFLWLSEIIPALLVGKTPKSAVTAGLWVNPIQVIDLSLVLPGMIISGILLLKKKVIGYLFAVPWLTFSALMGSSIIATMVMEIRIGNSSAVVPLIMVSAIVLASFWSLNSFLKKFRVYIMYTTKRDRI